MQLLCAVPQYSLWLQMVCMSACKQSDELCVAPTRNVLPVCSQCLQQCDACVQCDQVVICAVATSAVKFAQGKW